MSKKPEIIIEKLFDSAYAQKYYDSFHEGDEVVFTEGEFLNQKAIIFCDEMEGDGLVICVWDDGTINTSSGRTLVVQKINCKYDV